MGGRKAGARRTAGADGRVNVGVPGASDGVMTVDTSGIAHTAAQWQLPASQQLLLCLESCVAGGESGVAW